MHIVAGHAALDQIQLQIAKTLFETGHSAETSSSIIVKLFSIRRSRQTAINWDEKDMYSATTIKQADHTSRRSPGARQADAIVETRLWLDEYDWLFALLSNEKNVSPTFRFPDLISACVSIALTSEDASERIFGFLGEYLVLRDPLNPRRRESIWRAQYDLLLALQRSPANRHPNPNFQLDQLTTACVALARQIDPGGERILHQSRVNMADRSARRTARKSS
jgi:hypothetical protein